MVMDPMLLSPLARIFWCQWLLLQWMAAWVDSMSQCVLLYKLGGIA